MTKLHYLATILISTALGYFFSGIFGSILCLCGFGIGYSIAKYQIHRNKKKEL